MKGAVKLHMALQVCLEGILAFVFLKMRNIMCEKQQVVGSWKKGYRANQSTVTRQSFISKYTQNNQLLLPRPGVNSQTTFSSVLVE